MKCDRCAGCGYLVLGKGTPWSWINHKTRQGADPVACPECVGAGKVKPKAACPCLRNLLDEIKLELDLGNTVEFKDREAMLAMLATLVQAAINKQ